MFQRSFRKLAGFRSVGIALIVFLATNILVFLVLSVRPDLVEWLRLSADRPWGIVTSAFTHVDFYHIANNVEGFILAALLFLSINLSSRRAVRRRVSRQFLLLVFVAGIGANLLEYPLALASPWDASWGASGIVYGALGIALSAAVQTIPTHVKFIAKERRRWVGKPRRWGVLRFDRRSLRTFPSYLSLSLVASILIMLVFDAGGFLNVAPNVDVFAHGVGFLLGFIGFTALHLVGRKRAKYKSR
ncbi:MAG: rhomboid family intramembrane serine protease [Methanobacteriota archaeon]